MTTTSEDPLVIDITTARPAGPRLGPRARAADLLDSPAAARVNSGWRWIRHVWARVCDKAGRPFRTGEFWTTSPPPLKHLWDYTRSGDWVPGDQHRFLEVLGLLYGVVIAVPTSIALYAGAWLLQRPTRVFAATAVAALIWLTR
jgi:hypothetical protein